MISTPIKQGCAAIAFGICIALTPTAVHAETLSPEAALERALGTQDAPSPLRKIKAQQLKLAYTEPLAQTDSRPAVYVFNNNNESGFCIVSADDAVSEALLGYSDESIFDTATISPTMRWWLGEYARQIAAAVTSEATPAIKIPRAQRRSIAPLVKTRWNQDAPFNNDCPKIVGKSCVTGCVATALAQILAYHKYPAKGTGYKSYSWNNTTLSFDYASTTFDWNNMLDVYTSSATEAQKAAVASLMYACGVGVEMDYTTSESGASDFSVPNAMVDYFGYDKGIRFLDRQAYGISEWEEMIYDQLTNYGPVQYSGTSSDGGHSFVCDGYSSDGYFHINWGWGGMSDGYFLLTALDPGSQGIGGSSSGYNFNQSVIGNVKPAETGSTMYATFTMTDFKITQTSVSKGSNVQISGPIYNMSIGNLSGALGLKFTSKTDGTAYYAVGYTFTDLEPRYGYNAFQVNIPTSIPAGEYTVTPAYRYPTGVWQEIRVNLDGTQSYSATADATTVTFTANPAASIQAYSLKAESPFYMGKKFHLTATLVNSGTSEYYGTVAAAIFDSSGNLTAVGDDYLVDLEGGESTTLDYISAFTRTPQGVTLTAGSYTLYLINTTTFETIGSGISCTLQSSPGSTVIAVTGLHLVGDTRNADPNALQFEGTLSCTQGYFSDAVTIAIFPYSTGSVTAIAAFDTPVMFVNAGSEAPLKAMGSLSDYTLGAEYMAAAFSGSTQVSQLCRFRLRDTTGVVNSISVDSPESVYYTLDGLLVDGKPSVPGIYIMRTGTETMKVVVK